MKDQKTNLMPAHGGYRKLKTFQLSSLVYDWTIEFCGRFVDQRHRYRTNLTDRTDQNQTNQVDQSYRWNRQADQMIQAARSGRQNIAEGSRASGTSKKTELKLVNVARASLEELLLDFEDFLRQRNLKVWKKDDPDALRAREFLKKIDLSDRSDRTDQTRAELLSQKTLSNGERFANLMLCLIHQVNYLLDCQLKVLEKDLLEKGGFTENLYHKRKQFRGY